MREIKIELSFTKRDEDSLNRYLNDIYHIPMISPEEEVQLAIKIREGDQLALQKLVRTNLRFVVSVAKKYQGYGLSLSDLVNEGNIGLIRAAEKFDHSKGFKFISYAVWWIRQAIMATLSEDTRVIRVPMNQVISVQKIRFQQCKLEQQLEREPTPAEVASALEMKETAVIDHIYRHKNTKSLDEKLSAESELDLCGILPDPNIQAPDEPIIYQSLQEDISKLLKVLKKREQKLICELYGLNGDAALSMEAVADRNKLSKERVRQLTRESMTKLRQHAPKSLVQHFQN